MLAKWGRFFGLHGLFGMKSVAKRVDIGDDFTTWFGFCPDCGGTEWFEGPSGGACVNIKCANDACGTKLNTFANQAQRIGRDPRPRVGILGKVDE